MGERALQSSASAAADAVDHQPYDDEYTSDFPDIQTQPDRELNPFELELLERLNQNLPTNTETWQAPAQMLDHPPPMPVPRFADAYEFPGQVIHEDEQGITVFYRRKT
jgi:hypothetical protein